MKLRLRDKEYELKSKMRALLIYEQITEKTFEPHSVTEVMIYMYSVLLANNSDFELTFDAFLDALDEDRNALDDFNKWLLLEGERNKCFSDDSKKKARVK